MIERDVEFTVAYPDADTAQVMLTIGGEGMFAARMQDVDPTLGLIAAFGSLYLLLRQGGFPAADLRLAMSELEKANFAAEPVTPREKNA